jgi:hypothetical protein
LEPEPTMDRETHSHLMTIAATDSDIPQLRLHFVNVSTHNVPAKMFLRAAAMPEQRRQRICQGEDGCVNRLECRYRCPCRDS